MIIPVPSKFPNQPLGSSQARMDSEHDSAPSVDGSQSSRLEKVPKRMHKWAPPSRHRDPEEEHEKNERWLVSYADFITLLFAFFVVMYSLSLITTQDKYRVLSDSMLSAFRHIPGTSGGAQVSVNTGEKGVSIQVPLIKPHSKSDVAKSQTKIKMRSMAKEIRDALGPLIQNGKVRITEGAFSITVEINASVLFSSGDARLSPDAVQALISVAKILAPTSFPIIVAGHTDNIPISTPQFPSNWELSGARASSVVRLFIDNGVGENRFTATGYAAEQPLSENTTSEGRTRNRRVTITIESKTPETQLEISGFPN